jgi:hypothetical protein
METLFLPRTPFPLNRKLQKTDKKERKEKKRKKDSD